jgi:phospholipase C
MAITDRRNFIRLLGASAGLGTLSATMSSSITNALELSANTETGTIKDVKHVVILMQENRSFDHYFGTLKGVRGFGDRHPIPMTNGLVWQQSDGNRFLPPYHLDTKKTNAIAVPGTPHSFADTQAAWNQGKFGYWPKYKNPFSMGFYRREDIPYQFALAEAFTICDAYHCSITTGTDPNRIVFWSGSNHDPALRNKGINGTSEDSEPNNIRCWVTGALPEPGYTYKGSAFEWDTIPDVLEKAGVSWRIYQDPNDNWTGAMHGGLAFKSFRNAKKGDPLYEKGMSHWSLEQLKQDVLNDTLPQVTWILPNKEWSEHPSASTPLQGAEYTAKILNALTANPKVWGSTIFFETFDENDGLFDHLPAPAPPSYDKENKICGGSNVNINGFYFNDHANKYRDPEDTISGAIRPWGLGPRVPMYIVSPWSKGGYVFSEVADHTSVAQFLEKCFRVKIDAISEWNRAVCSDLTAAFNFKNPEDISVLALPDASDSQNKVLQQIHRKRIMPPDTPQPLIQEAGFRPSRALPYSFDVSLKNPTEKKLTITNLGKKGVVIHIYNRLNLDNIPYRYTVAANSKIDADITSFFINGKYDLWILGPNGFNRTFVGNNLHDDFAANIEFAANARVAKLKVKNLKSSTIDIIFDNSVYLNTQQTVKIGGNGAKEFSLDIGKFGNWYDVTLKSGDTVKRFAGRYENGRDLISDPAAHSATVIDTSAAKN